MKTPLISFVTHGRNDGFMGDFLWRVSTCVNQIARSYAALGRLDEIEILIGDWGSEQKTLREAMTLEPAARRVTRFCTVPPAVAARLNRDGHYAYSPAANIPIRRAKGKFIFSMDSDAWVPLKTADYLLQIADGKNPTGLDLDKTFFWASRQHVPFSFVATSPSIEELDRYLVEQREKLFWTGKCNLKEFRGGAVAIFGKREHFHAIRGYNEALVHWGWQDIDIHCRMAMLFTPHDLWDFGAEMFHLEHYPKRGGAVAGGRKVSPQIVPTEPIVNGLDWGAGNDLVDVSAAPSDIQPAPAKAASTGRPRNIVISGTNFWNPGDDFVRDGIIRVLQHVFPSEPLNFLFYNFNADFFPQAKFAGIGNYISKGDLEKYRDFVDAVVIAGLSAGDEIKDLYRWVVANGLAEKVYLIGAGYENDYVAKHISQEPEATIFRKARVVTGRTAKTPEFIREAGIPYHHINCPAILSVPEVKKIATGHKIQRIGFSIQLPHGQGLANHSCAREQYELSVAVLRDLSREYAVEVIAHHKTEYFHFLNLLRDENIPVIFSSFYQDLHQLYPRYDLVITTRLHSSLFANGHGIPGIIINDTDRHTHTLDGFLHSLWVNTREKFDRAFARWVQSDLTAIASELDNFKRNLLAQYVRTLRPIFQKEAAPSVDVTVVADSLPVHFFTIVLNGNPFIRHHIEQMRRLPFRWHWHIVEGVAELNHDTAWSKTTGGKISADLHRNGLSVDGTTEYLDALKNEFPENITIYRPAAGKFWDGKREMVNAPLRNISEGCLLWQVDADELWTFSQMVRLRAMFLLRPEKSAAYFYCHYFVGPGLVITSRDTYGNNSSYEWLRVWRYQPGDRWVAHEPPRLHRGEIDVASTNAFRHTETEAMGLVFQHYAYATEEQIRFKESYYGYAGAVDQWRKLQQTGKFPQRLADHFAWVKDEAIVNTAGSSGIKKLAPDEWFEAVPEKSIATGLLDGAKRILFVRTDSIGDAVLASSMLEPIRKRCPQAKLAVLCQQHVAELFVACPFVDAVICYDRKKMDEAGERAQILAEISEFGPDVVLNAIRSRDHFSNELAQMVRGARHIAIEGDLNNISTADHARSLDGYEFLIPSPGGHITELGHHANFLSGLDIKGKDLQPVVWTAPADEILADAFFQQRNLDPMRTMAFFPFTQHEVKDYTDFIGALESFSDWNILILGGPEKKAQCDQLAEKLPGHVYNLAGRTSLREMAAIIRRCRILVGSDTSGPHFACAVGVPNVVLLGGGHFGRFMPYSPLTSIVALPLACFGCNWRCPHVHAHCVKDVSAEVLAEAIRQTLEKSAAKTRVFLQSSNSWSVGAGLPKWQYPDSFPSAGLVEIIMVGRSPKKDHAVISPSLAEAANATCPVCQILAPATVEKKGQIYHRCPTCECVFTPKIAEALIKTENNGNSARHDQNQDLIRLHRVIQALSRRPENLIDFGCGQGETTRFLQTQGIQVVGIDQDTPVQLKDVPDASVDGIMMVEVIEHLYDPHAIFQQFNRILKPGGVVYIESSFADKKDLANWGYLDPAIGHCTVHTLRSMASLAEKKGFKLQWLNANVGCFSKQVTIVSAGKSPVTAAQVEVIGEGIPDPLVSVVVSTHKAEKFIRPCLENLSRQKNFNRCEVIVVDSGSPENERAIVLELQQKFANIRYVRTERETIYGAWNCGLALARGRYWANVNTDDGLRNDALEVLTSAMDKHSDCAMAYADTAWTAKPNDTFPSVNIVRTVKYPHYSPVETIFYCVTGCLQFWRTAALRQLGGFDASLRAAGDYEATLKLMAARMNAVHVPEVLSLFYQNTAGLTQGDSRAATEHGNVMNQHRLQLDVANIFQVNPGDPASNALAWAALAVHASKFTIPWEDAPSEHCDYAFECFHKALELDPENDVVGMNLIALHLQLNRLSTTEAELVRRWPKMRQWIDRMRHGEPCLRPNVNHTVVGPVYRPFEQAQRPTPEQLSREPEALRPWICRIEGRHVYLSEDLFPRPSGSRYRPEELQAGGKRLATVLASLPPYYAHIGGAGDALLTLAACYDQKPDAVLFSHPNGVGAAKALFDAFPKLSKIYFLPQHAEPYFHIVLRYMVYELKNCLGAGATPKYNYDEEWKATLDIEKKYRIKKSPRWAADFCQNQGSRRVAVAPKGSLSGMVGSKRNIILPEQWPQVIAHIIERGFEPVILGVPNEEKDYPALPGCVDARGENFPGQMKLIGRCAGLVGADSWAKTFSALANIPTIVFEPLKGADLCTWKDASDWVFIEPWPAIQMVKSLDGFRRAFDTRIAKIVAETPAAKAVVAWEGSFLDYGSLSHVNRELTARLTGEMNLSCIGSNALNAKGNADGEMLRCAKKLTAKAPANVAVTVRHQWPPNWSKPASGALVVIQPWEYGSLPKAWVANEKNVDEFWVPSPLVRAMYLNSGIAPEKVRVIPNGVDLKKFRPGVRPLALPTKKKFKFLFVGGTIYRKGPDVLLEAFTQAFTSADDVCLVVKDFGGDSFYQGQTAEAAIHALQQKPGAPEIIYLQEELASEQMPSLYAACDCFVLPYRGEGFGMPVLEAMACGLPVIVTGGGATESFVSGDAGWKISSQLLRLADHVGHIPLVSNGWMFEPGKAHLVALLKHAASRPEECRKRGANGRLVAEKRFDWSDISALVAHRLKELAASVAVNLPVPSTPENSEKKVAAQSLPSQIPEVARVGRLAEARELFSQKKLQAAWEATVTAMAHRPFHPEASMLLAEIALAAGDARSARACGEYTRKVAPGWNVPKQFLNRQLKGAAKCDWLVLPDSIANRQSPIANRLTVCLIAKNEEKFLAQCLKSVRDLAQQIIVVDTGSTDRTVEIAREFNAEVYSHPWNDDFAAARNAALEHANGDWVLVLDADEELPVAQHANLLADLKKSDALAHRLPLANAGENKQGRSFVPRLFRNAPGIFYQGRIHEQVFPSLLSQSKTWGLKTSLGTAEILHHGYSKEMVRDRNKIERNLKLLRLALEENPSDANLLMNLGLELVRSDDLAAGVERYRAAFSVMSRQPLGEVVPELREALLTQFTSQLYKLPAYAEVVEILNSPLAQKDGLTASLHFSLGLAYFELKQFSEAADQMRQCIAKRKLSALTPINTDIHTSAPQHCLALSLARLGESEAAEKAFLVALNEAGRIEDVKKDYAKFLAETGREIQALEQLNEIIAQSPQHAEAWITGGKMTLAKREYLEFARDWTGEAFKALPGNVIVAAQRAEALMLNGDFAGALELWEKLWDHEHSPSVLAALILCEAIEKPTTHAPDEGPDESVTSREFITWYQRLLKLQLRPSMERVNEHLEKLARALPTAAQMIENALAEPAIPSQK
jgi:glycosyltransferase involved in cell wall biosynthesis/ADP-heptose:LPS heptosyltransferase/ubiquinone/menaquinone biosynthesis C-methylase UbiE/Tfp pilus assembly protein PilF